MSTRTANSIRNTTISFISQILSVILSFATRTIFIKILGAEYLGLNGLFYNILSMLSFAELGVGTAIVYAMYKPLAENDENRISALMNLYENAYKVIGIVIAILGVIFIPFLDYLIKDEPNIPYLSLIYLMFLGNSVISYFFACKRSILIASQKAYVNTLNQIFFLIIQNLIQVVILFLYKQYILYLATQMIITFCSNIAISNKVDKLFPYLKSNRDATIDEKTKINLKKNVAGTMSSRLGGIVVTGSDNLLIAAFIGIKWVGIYSNYVLIVNTITSLISQVLNAITASVGNLIAKESDEKAYDIFKKIFFINFIITLFSSVFFIVLLNPFINFWIGETYLLDNMTVVFIVINFFVIQMRRPAIIFIDAYGFYWEIKWKSIVEALINLTASLIFINVFKMGIVGVLLGTLISNLLTNLWWEPYVVYKSGFKVSLKEYFQGYIKYSIIGTFIIIIAVFFCNLINLDGFWELIVKTILSFSITSISILLIFIESRELQYLKKLVISIIDKF